MNESKEIIKTLISWHCFPTVVPSYTYIYIYILNTKITPSMPGEWFHEQGTHCISSVSFKIWTKARGGYFTLNRVAMLKPRWAKYIEPIRFWGCVYRYKFLQLLYIHISTWMCTLRKEYCYLNQIVEFNLSKTEY